MFWEVDFWYDFYIFVIGVLKDFDVIGCCVVFLGGVDRVFDLW